MATAFNTINRNKLLDIYHNISENDENRMIRKMLTGTKLSIKVNDHVGKESFITNIGSPQGDGISGINFNIYFENALKEIRHKRQAFKEAQEMLNIPIDETHPTESIYADDADFIDTEPHQSKWIQEDSTSILKEYNLHANPDKT